MRTVAAYDSMGGWAAYKLGLSHPDLYAEAVALAGPPQCGVSVDADALVNPASARSSCAPTGPAGSPSSARAPTTVGPRPAAGSRRAPPGRGSADTDTVARWVG
ncbi:hypothetical protein [Nocardioides sp.]|uniref:hypothetical protein n=1 Tax=Nocardioides sp. TaxID=35761 RepID=UPI00263A2981|nr:hypothetical protein [Nocardioides sp.]